MLFGSGRTQASGVGGSESPRVYTERPASVPRLAVVSPAMRAQTSFPRRRRAPWIALLVLCSFWIGLVAGTAIGAQFFVPADSGLAGPAIALGYGAMGALAAALLAGVLARRLPPRSLRRSAVVALLLAVLAALVVGYRFVTQQAERRAHAGLDAWTLQHPRLDPRCAARLS